MYRLKADVDDNFSFSPRSSYPRGRHSTPTSFQVLVDSTSEMTTADISGKKFGRLTVIRFIGFSARSPMWRCKCDCGRLTVVHAGNLRRGHTKSCGCLALEQLFSRSFRHGFTKRNKFHPLYAVWNQMKQRCLNPKCKEYRHYGAIGVKVCRRWMKSFPNFLKDVGERPPKMSLDRFPNRNGNYEPGNVRWATDEMQANNKNNNRKLTFNGITLGLSQWARRVGIRKTTIEMRLLRGWPLAQALTTRPHKYQVRAVIRSLM